MKLIIPPRLEALIKSRLGVSTPPSVNTPSTAGGCDPSDIRGATSRPRGRPENYFGTPCVLSDAEIVRTLMRYRYDRTFRGERRVPIKTLADYVGLSHETVYQAMRGAISDRTRAKLSWALTAINDRRLQFCRHGQRWQVKSAGLLLSNPGH
jgi:hypothetical protein